MRTQSASENCLTAPICNGLERPVTETAGRTDDVHGTPTGTPRKRPLAILKANDGFGWVSLPVLTVCFVASVAVVPVVERLLFASLLSV